MMTLARARLWDQRTRDGTPYPATRVHPPKLLSDVCFSTSAYAEINTISRHAGLSCRPKGQRRRSRRDKVCRAPEPRSEKTLYSVARDDFPAKEQVHSRIIRLIPGVQSNAHVAMLRLCHRRLHRQTAKGDHGKGMRSPRNMSTSSNVVGVASAVTRAWTCHSLLQARAWPTA